MKKAYKPAYAGFVEVIGEDGRFYDIVNKRSIPDHLSFLRDGGYEARPVNQSDVPPCIVRDFTYGDGTSYVEKAWRGGEDFYIDA